MFPVSQHKLEWILLLASVGVVIVLFNPVVANALVDATEYSTDAIIKLFDRASINWLTMRGSIFKQEETDESVSSNESSN